MPKLAIGMRAERGFTLIEILVVVLILGITLGFAVLSFGDFGANRQALVSAEEFSSYLKLLQQRAIIETNSLGIRFDNRGYTSYRFQNGFWQALPVKGVFRWRSFPEKVIVSLKRIKSKNNINTPDIVISPLGDMNDFSIDFGTINKPNATRLIGKQNGQLILEKS